jgi:TonB-dependent starch-binding outer membrane protein SusC
MKVTFMRKLMVMLVCLLGVALTSHAQSVSGTVADKNGKGLSGITVTVKGTDQSATTDADGKFTFDSGISKESVLVFTGPNYLKREITVGNASNVNAVLAGSDANDVVVVGYGSSKKKDLTGSVAVVTTKDFNQGVIATPEQLFQGRTPGVVITPSSGEPGAAATITIRGTASIRGSNDPLYVVDGMPLGASGTIGGTGGIEGSSTPKNPLLFLNPNDIESVTILKDASSAAIYGSRGANGVVLITTKTGKGRKGGFDFSVSTAVSTTAKRYDVLNASDFLKGQYDANIAGGTPAADAAIANADLNKGADTDWQDEIFRTGIAQNYNLGWGINRGSTAIRLSGSYSQQDGIVKNSGLKRLTGRMNLTQKFLDNKLRFDIALTASNVKNEYAPNSNNAGYQGSLIGAALIYNPTYPVKNPDGTFYDANDGSRNPAMALAYFDDKDRINRVLTTIAASYQFTKELSYKVNFGYDNSTATRKTFSDPRLTSAFNGATNKITLVVGQNPNPFGGDNGNNIAGNGRALYQDLDSRTLLVEHTLSYNKTFKEHHSINAIAGYSYQNDVLRRSAKIAWGQTTPVVLPSDNFKKDINSFSRAPQDHIIPYYEEPEMQSFFTRVNYIYKEKYFLTFTFRADGSSRFGKDNRYGVFPAFAAKWRLLKEDFAEGLKEKFSDLSVRANYGILGSQDGLDAYAGTSYRVTNPLNNNLDTFLVWQGNNSAKWEQSTTTGIGVDYALIGNRLNGSLDFYYSRRKDLLFFGPTPGGFGARSNEFQNLPGVVSNSGLEFMINYLIVKSNKFNWDASFNFTYQKNKITGISEKFPTGIPTGTVNGQGLTGAYSQAILEGQSLFTWRMPVFQGFDANGNSKLLNGEVGGTDEIVGSALPKYIFGLTNSFFIGRWNASMFWNASTGFKVYNNTANALFLRGSLRNGRNISRDAANSGENPVNSGGVSTRFLEKGDFLRLSNLTLSYNFNIKSKAIKSLVANITGQNLLLITNYSGLDPEVNVDKALGGVPSRGLDYVAYPRARTFTLGVNVGF